MPLTLNSPVGRVHTTEQSRAAALQGTEGHFSGVDCSIHVFYKRAGNFALFPGLQHCFMQHLLPELKARSAAALGDMVAAFPGHDLIVRGDNDCLTSSDCSLLSFVRLMMQGPTNSTAEVQCMSQGAWSRILPSEQARTLVHDAAVREKNSPTNNSFTANIFWQVGRRLTMCSPTWLRHGSWWPCQKRLQRRRCQSARMTMALKPHPPGPFLSHFYVDDGISHLNDLSGGPECGKS